MQNELLDQIEKNTRATSSATQALGYFIIYSAVAVLVGVGVGIVLFISAGFNLEFSEALSIAQVGGAGTAVVAQIVVIVVAALKLRTP